MGQPTEYKNKKALSQSSLKTIETNPSKFYKTEYLWLTGQIMEKPEYPISDSMKIGEIVDISHTRPRDLGEEYVVINDPPTGQMKSFVDMYFDLERLNPSASTDSLAQLAYTSAGFKRDKLQTVLDRFKEEGVEYYNALRKSIGKEVVSADLMATALGVVEDMKNDEFIGPILSQAHEKQDVHYQLEIYFTLEGVPVKSLLDMAVVDNVAKTIQPYDIKTCGDSFWVSFGTYRYDIQGSFYDHSIHVWRDTVLGKNDYKILPFKFLVGFTNGRGYKPEIWEMGWKDLYVGKNGGVNRYGRKVKGYLELIRDYKWHVDNNLWDYPAEVYRLNGVRPLNYYE